MGKNESTGDVNSKRTHRTGQSRDNVLRKVGEKNRIHE